MDNPIHGLVVRLYVGYWPMVGRNLLADDVVGIIGVPLALLGRVGFS